jgi:hypothetical protein
MDTFIPVRQYVRREPSCKAFQMSFTTIRRAIRSKGLKAKASKAYWRSAKVFVEDSKAYGA